MGIPSVHMSPPTFIKRPAIWLQTISKYRITTSGAPNFAYDLCAQRISPNDMVGVDLSSWTVAFNGAEPVRAATLRNFTNRFMPYGFDPLAFYPCYGLAEATLLVTGFPSEQGPTTLIVDPAMLEHGTVQTLNNSESCRELVGCGSAINLNVQIVDPATFTSKPADAVGEIWIHGGSVGAGYWESPDLTEDTFQALTATGDGPFLRTGDLGFLHEGELFVTGRIKDLMIINGRNIYPQDVEAATLNISSSFRSAAAFSVDTDKHEAIVIVVEGRQTDDLDPAVLSKTIRQILSEEFGVSVAGIIFVSPTNFARTTSGKVMRSDMRHRFLQRTLDTIYEDIQEGLNRANFT